MLDRSKKQITHMGVTIDNFNDCWAHSSKHCPFSESPNSFSGGKGDATSLPGVVLDNRPTHVSASKRFGGSAGVGCVVSGNEGACRGVESFHHAGNRRRKRTAISKCMSEYNKK